ncbi:MAG: ABC transporter ATP-binding protein [Clostridia bacterium]|nr:ABC transporter ATP-binding protein [Clostridia bacterium]
MIEAKEISKRYGDKTVFERLSLTVETGVWTVLTGASGLGKTTLLRVLAGLEQPDEGVVSGLDGLRKSFVFQENRLLERASALENILCVAPDRERAMKMLELVGLGTELSKPAGKLSGGMKRRLAIARALAYGGDVFFLDEPLRELDKGTETQIASLLRGELQGKTVLLITHDEDFANRPGNTVLRFAGPPMKPEA